MKIYVSYIRPEKMKEEIPRSNKPIYFNNIHTTITDYCALKIALHTILEIAFVQQAFVAALVRIDC